MEFGSGRVILGAVHPAMGGGREGAGSGRVAQLRLGPPGGGREKEGGSGGAARLGPIPPGGGREREGGSAQGSRLARPNRPVRGINGAAHVEEKRRGVRGMGWAGKKESAQNSFPN